VADSGALHEIVPFHRRSQVHRLFHEQISTRVRERPEMKAALAAAREYRSLGAKVTLVVHEMKRLGRGALELLKVAEELRDAEIELEFLTGPWRASTTRPGTAPPCSRSSPAMAESERDYIRDKTLEGQETARTKGKAIGGTKVSDEGHARHRKPTARRGTPLPARDRLPPRHPHRKEARPAPGPCDRDADAARTRRADGLGIQDHPVAPLARISVTPQIHTLTHAPHI
jgi:hypothetical protein